jgi:hypothetical protein
MDNLRVIPKEENLKKRDKDPELGDWIQADIVAMKAFIFRFNRRGVS